jgi:hypothetical protein
MSFLLTLDDSPSNEQLIPIFEAFEADIAKAAPLFQLEGRRLEEVARVLPYHQAMYNQRAQEAKQLVKWLENDLARIEARMIKNMAATNARAFGQRETTAIVGGEREVVQQKQLIIEASLIQQKLDAIVDAFRQMGWMVGNVTKLRVAELQDVVL